MPKFRVTVKRYVTFTKQIEVAAVNDLVAGDRAEEIAEADGFEWGSADDDVTQVEGADEIE